MPHLTGSLARMGYGVVAVGSDLSYYQQRIDSITDYEVIRLDENGLICSCHPGAEQLPGSPASEIVGRPVSIFYTEEDIAAGRLEQELYTARETGRCEIEGCRVRKDGSRFWASVSITPIRDREGALVGYVKIARDLTERREQLLAMAGDEQMLQAM